MRNGGKYEVVLFATFQFCEQAVFPIHLTTIQGWNVLGKSARQQG